MIRMWRLFWMERRGSVRLAGSVWRFLEPPLVAGGVALAGGLDCLGLVLVLCST